MARGGARLGAGRPAGKSANTSTASARARPRASRTTEIKSRGRLTRSSGGRSESDDGNQKPILGRHRLLCGDSTVATDVERVLGGVEPHLMVTDPPYGVEYDPAWRNKAKFSDGKNHRGVRSLRSPTPLVAWESFLQNHSVRTSAAK